MEPGIRIFTVKPHRPEGKVNRQGQDFGCNLCAGFCDFKWFPSSFSVKNPTIAVDFGSNGYARIYFLEVLDTDDPANPIFYVDEDVTVSDSNGDVTIPSGQFQVTQKDGVLNVGDQSFSYNSYIDVPFTE